MTDKDKKKVLAAHLANQEASLFLESLKLKYVHGKSLSSNEYAKAYEVMKGRINAMEDEYAWMCGQLENLK